MTQKQLDVFLDLAETLNFRKTADHLYLSQTTVTFQIQSLEEELKVKLFDRTTRFVRLTPAGETFQKYARKILSLINQAISDTTAVAAGYSGLLQLGFCIDTNKAGLSKLVKTFSENNPQIRVDIHGGYPEQLLHELSTDQCGIVITPHFDKLDVPELEYYRIGRYKQIAAFHAEHPFSQKEALHFSDFAGETLIRVSKEEIELDFTKEFLTKLKQDNVQPKVLTSTDNVDAVFLMLEANLGVTIIPEYFSERLAGNKQVKTCTIDEDLEGANLLAVWKADNKSEELKRFVELLQQSLPQG